MAGLHTLHNPAPPVLAMLSASRPISALMLSDRLLTLAQDAEQAGHLMTASRLVTMALDVLDRPRMQ